MIRSGLVALALAAGIAAGVTPASACAPLTIFFDWNSARIEDQSQAALERLAVTLAWKGPEIEHVLLTSHTDSTGSAAANRAMARRRAEAVRRVLTAYHVPAQLIAIRTIGAQRPRVATPANVREPRNRRVELLIQMSAEGQARQIAEGRPIC